MLCKINIFIGFYTIKNIDREGDMTKKRSKKTLRTKWLSRKEKIQIKSTTQFGFLFFVLFNK
jgi:hypothetical protein